MSMIYDMVEADNISTKGFNAGHPDNISVKGYSYWITTYVIKIIQLFSSIVENIELTSTITISQNLVSSICKAIEVESELIDNEKYQ